MSIRSDVAAVVVALLLLTAGCTVLRHRSGPGTEPDSLNPGAEPTDAGDSAGTQLDCSNSNPYAGVELGKALPPAPDGWSETQPVATI